MPDLRVQPDLAARFRVAGMALVALAVGLFVIGILLLTTCQTETVVTPFVTTVGCAYPFQWYGLAFLGSAVGVTVVSANLLAESFSSPKPGPESVVRRRMISAMLVVGAAVLFVLAGVLLNLG